MTEASVNGGDTDDFLIETYGLRRLFGFVNLNLVGNGNTFPKKEKSHSQKTAPAKTALRKRPTVCEKHQSGAEQDKQQVKGEIPPFEIGLAYFASHQPNEHEKAKGEAEKAESGAYEHKSVGFCQKNTPKIRKVKKQENWCGCGADGHLRRFAEDAHLFSIPLFHKKAAGSPAVV